MITETIYYQCDDVKMKGYLACSESSRAKRPVILVAHAWRGQDDFAREKARALAELGYVGFAIDIYGDGKTTTDNDQAYQLMLPFFLDRKLLRERVTAALAAVKTHELVDSGDIGAIGFCFGGLAVIELLRSGAPVRGVVSFHGLLGNTLNEHKAKKIPDGDIKGSLMILHGYKDPMVSSADVQAVQSEFDKAGIDWQMTTYGKAVHAFTNPMATDEKGGMLYNPQIASRAWQEMVNFFEEIFPS